MGRNRYVRTSVNQILQRIQDGCNLLRLRTGIKIRLRHLVREINPVNRDRDWKTSFLRNV